MKLIEIKEQEPDGSYTKTIMSIPDDCEITGFTLDINDYFRVYKDNTMIDCGNITKIFSLYPNANSAEEAIKDWLIDNFTVSKPKKVDIDHAWARDWNFGSSTPYVHTCRCDSRDLLFYGCRCKVKQIDISDKCYRNVIK